MAQRTERRLNTAAAVVRTSERRVTLLMRAEFQKIFFFRGFIMFEKKIKITFNRGLSFSRLDHTKLRILNGMLYVIALNN